MNVPWKVLTDPILTRTDVLIYSCALRLLRFAPDKMVACTRLGEQVVMHSLQRLAERGYLVCGLNVFYVHLRFKRKVSRVDAAPPYSGSYSERSKTGTDKGVQISKKVLAMFYGLYETEYKSSYCLRGSSSAEDLAHIQCLITQTGELASWCVQALFSTDMAWVKNKQLTFFTFDNVERYVRPIAIAIQKKGLSKPEWTSSSTGGGLISAPKEV